MNTRCFAALLAGLIAGSAGAQTPSDYAGWRQREIKALSAQQIDDLNEGRGMGLSLPAELNGAPGPLHALALADTLALTPAQSAELERIVAEMKSEARRLGRAWVDTERRLDQAFRDGTADEAAVARLSADAGRLQGELRNVHLQAHLRTRRLLQPQQIAAYDRARGYAGEQGLAGSHDH